jgi:hypothetical protein
MPTIVLDEVNRHYLVDAPDAASVEKFLANLEDHGKCVASVQKTWYGKGIKDGDGEIDLMLDNDGKVIFDKQGMIVRDSYKYWPTEVANAQLYRYGKRNLIYVITPEREGDYAVTLQVVENFGGLNQAKITSAKLLEHSLKLSPASLDGFAIGYSGAGSHQLAHAILLHEFWNPILAAEAAETFRNQIIASLTGQNVISGEWVRRWVTPQKFSMK